MEGKIGAAGTPDSDTIQPIRCKLCRTPLEWRFGMFTVNERQYGAPYCPTCKGWFTADVIDHTGPLCVAG